MAQPSNVAAARRFVDEALTRWDHPELIADVGLCVSEMTTNALLHAGASFYELAVEKYADTVRVAVSDPGGEPVQRLARQPQLSDAVLDDLGVDEAHTTGRGLFLVSALSSRWGIEELPGGKRVWAEFRTDGGHGGDEFTPARVTTLPRQGWSAPPPASWAIVRFRGVPPATLVAHDANLADYARELRLVGEQLSDPAYRDLGTELSDYIAQRATNWDAARLIAHHALAAGEASVDIDVAASPDVAESLQSLRRMIARAEALSAHGFLMTMPAPEPVQRLRDWLEGEFLGQAVEGRPPVSWPEWCGDE